MYEDLTGSGWLSIPAEASSAVRSVATLWPSGPIAPLAATAVGLDATWIAVSEAGLTSTSAEVGYSVTDVVAKVGFGVLVHKVAKLRTAEDVAAGIDTHPEPVWSSHVHKSDGVLPEVRRIARD